VSLTASAQGCPRPALGERVWLYESQSGHPFSTAAEYTVQPIEQWIANVFYEVGYAHALGKLVLLLTKNAEDIPFDMKHFPHIIYDNSITKLRSELINHLIWTVTESKKLASEQNAEDIGIYLNGVEIPEDSSGRHTVHIDVPYNAIQSHGVLQITLSNKGSVSIDEPLQVYLMTERTELNIPAQIIVPPINHRIYGSKTKMFNLGKIADMYVGSVEQFDIDYRVRAISPKHDEFRCQIRVNSNAKQYFFPCHVWTAEIPLPTVEDP
jgi:hypothetical protein